MDDNKQLTTRQQELELESVEIFEQVLSEKKNPKQISEERGMALRTVYSRISTGRKIFEREIRNVGPGFLADIWKKYEIIWEAAKNEWDSTKDVSYLREMRSVLEAMRKMISLDSAPKSPVNEEGKAVPDQLILVFNESQYQEKEKALKIIEGNSTAVPLTSDQNNIE